MAVDLLAAGPVSFDFRKVVDTSATNPIQVSTTAYTESRGYGWTTLSGGMGSNSLVVAKTGTFSVAVPNGEYEAVAVVGGVGEKLNIRLQAEGQAVPQGVLSAGASLPKFTFNSRVTDGKLDIGIVGPYSGTYNFMIDSLVIKPLSLSAEQLNAQAVSTWRSQMLQYGRQHADWLIANQNGPFDPALGATYYDAARVFYQIADDTGDPYWRGAAKAAVNVYRDRYVLPNNGGVPGYWNFARGLAEDFRRTGDVASRNAALLLARNAAYAADATPLAWTVDQVMSREVAYSLSAQVEAEMLGAARRPRTAQLAEQAMGHIDQWTAPAGNRGPSVYVRPFMVGLTTEGLIRYWDLYRDPRVLPKITQALEWIWANTWVPTSGAFRYTDIDTANLPNAANPATPAAVDPRGGGSAGGGLIAGTYTLSYTVVTAVGETLTSPPSQGFEVTPGAIPRVTLPAVPAGAQSLSIYLARAGDPAGATRYAAGITATAFDLGSPATPGAPKPPTTSTATASGYNSGGTAPAPDLNQLIAPAYAWVYQRTGNVAYRDRADAIFAGGVKEAWMGSAKQFNQNYRWSFDYLKWRSAPPGTY